MERKHLMEDMDKYLADLNQWKKKREALKKEKDEEHEM